MHIEMKQQIYGRCNPSWEYGLLYFMKPKNDMHAPAVLQKLVIHCLILKLKI